MTNQPDKTEEFPDEDMDDLAEQARRAAEKNEKSFGDELSQSNDAAA